MDRKIEGRQIVVAAALALAVTGAFAAGTSSGSDPSDSASGKPSQERANPTANGNEAAANSQASNPRTQKDEVKNWNAAPSGSKAQAKRYDSTDPGKNNADEPTSQPSSHGANDQTTSGQG